MRSIWANVSQKLQQQNEVADSIEESPIILRKTILEFLDILPIDLDHWERALYDSIPNLQRPEEIKIRFIFSVPAGTNETNYIDQMFQSEIEENTKWWLLNAELDSVRVRMVTDELPSTILFNFDSENKQYAVARYYSGDGKYHIPNSSLLKSDRASECPRHAITGIFAAGNDTKYFRDLITSDSAHTTQYRLRRTLPLSLALIANTEHLNLPWVAESTRLHNGYETLVPKDWYDTFAVNMEKWLATTSFNDIPLRLHLLTPLTVDVAFDVDVVFSAIRLQNDICKMPDYLNKDELDNPV